MRYLRFALLPLLLLACSEQAPTEPIEDGPAFNWMNNPDVGNLKVFRSQKNTTACWTDPGTGFRVCQATMPLGGGTEPDCGLQDPADPADWQQVLVDPDAVRVINNIVGDAYITIRDTNVAGTCFDHALVAEGWGTFHINDNDQYQTGGSNINTWGFRSRGDLVTVGGDAVKYSGHGRFAWSADKGFRVLASQVNLH